MGASMTSRASGWAALCAVLAAIVLLMFPLYARGHETLGQWGKHGLSEYLYGHKIGNPLDAGPVNCCLYKSEPYGKGDCRQLADVDVKIVPGGYEWGGEFISHAETNVSPPHPHTGEFHFYGCRHDPGGYFGNNPKAHCFFAPPTGS
jgi:hypothetical protein